MGSLKQGINDFATWCHRNHREDMLSEYDIDRNLVGPSEIMYGSNSKVWWKCANGHLYEAPMGDRTRRNRACLVCRNRVALKGYNDIASLYPELIREWDFEKNKDKAEPDSVTKISNQVVWWRCPKGHSYEQRIAHRTLKGMGCPYCSGHRVLKGFNDLTTVVPDIVECWDYTKNAIAPDQITVGSGKKVWWKCQKCGESFFRSVSNQYGTKVLCANCVAVTRGIKRHNKVLERMGSLCVNRPDLLEEWDYEKNDNLGLFPESVTIGNTKKAWWICKTCGHRWQASINSRTRTLATGCPVCGIDKSRNVRYRNLLSKRKSLADTETAVMLDWDYERNTVNPKDLLETSGQSCWWFCHVCGHSWKTRVYNRIKGIGCPNCAKERGSSFPEQAVLFYLSRLYNDCVNRDSHLGRELDIYIPSKKVGVEYDGVAFHQYAEKDSTKGRICAENGIKLFRIREQGCPELLEDDESVCFVYKYGDWSKLECIIEEIITKIGDDSNQVDINIERDQADIYSQYISLKKQKSLQEMYPEIAKEWNYRKNGKVLPSMVYGGSEKRFWWICNKGHEYKTPVAGRTNGGRGCPYCTKQRLLVGFNDFATCYPDIAKEWDYEKNNGLRPEDVIGGAKKIWWRCPNNHSYLATMNSRTSNGQGCPYCSGRRAISGETDLFTTRPELIGEWDWERNKGIDPEEIKRGSKNKVWWICPKGHSYDCTVAQRLKSGCPICAGKRVLIGINDLKSQEPEIIKEWDYEKNTIKPDEVTRMSGKRVWWKCRKGHSYSVRIRDKVKDFTQCPICCNKIVQVGYNDLATTHPEIAKEWDFEKNLPLAPQSIVAGTARKVWWRCLKCSYGWCTSVASRTRLGNGCPKCGAERSAQAKKKKIVCVETGEVFVGINEAKQKYPIGNIGKCLRGESKTAAGYHWKIWSPGHINE